MILLNWINRYKNICIIYFVEFSFSTICILKLKLEINAGEKIALLGKSGSGKSTLISIANGTISPDKGKVIYKGINIKKIKTQQKIQIATLWQDLRLIEELNVGQNINAGALGSNNFL